MRARGGFPVRAAMLLLALMLLASPGGLAAQERAGRAADPRAPFKVMMVLWRGCEDACRGFQDYLSFRGVPVQYVMRQAGTLNLKFPDLVAEARALKVDLVVTWGTTATLGMVGEYDKPDPARYLTDIPVVFMIVTDPLATKVVERLERPGRNVTGTLVIVPEETQLRAIRSYLPFRRIGIAYNEDEVNAVSSVERVRALAGEMGFELVALRVPRDEAGKPIAASLPDVVQQLADAKVDLIYIGSSSFILNNRDVFTRAAVERGLPVAAAGEVPVVEADALLGLVSRYYTVGQLTGTRAEQILVDGRKPGDIPVEALSRFSLIVNMEVAHKLHLYPPLLMLNAIEAIKTGRPPAGAAAP
ncbi:ABC transporter substrate-binding protein [Starkeya koreensis]|uniref:ABC transporter substrate-binding protein n=1 Tax=Ancylobacter koreensis TaxID=266121 RepID=A0ABT0DQ81_9HYPH|nr:ABC transporter substrate-binding protein [Ancylobacter koreensis]MCK0209440.1 ABC transporter substrate-binding protein [Ancylobacter koreensis]